MLSPEYVIRPATLDDVAGVTEAAVRSRIAADDGQISHLGMTLSAQELTDAIYGSSPGDEPSELIRQYRGRWHENITAAIEDPARYFIRVATYAGRAGMHGAEIADEVVGVLAVSLDASGELFLGSTYVMTEHWRRGVGSTLFGEVLKAYPDVPMHTIVSLGSHGLSPAEHFYLSCGFRPTGEFQDLATVPSTLSRKYMREQRIWRREPPAAA